MEIIFLCELREGRLCLLPLSKPATPRVLRRYQMCERRAEQDKCLWSSEKRRLPRWSGKTKMLTLGLEGQSTIQTAEEGKITPNAEASCPEAKS